MSRIRALVVAALGLGLLAPGLPGPAYGDITATGYACGFTAVRDPTAAPGTFAGEVDGGPVAVADLPDPASPTTSWDPAATPSSATVACTIQVNTGYHAGGDAAIARASGAGVVVLPATQIAYAAMPGDWVYLCTEWTVTNGLGQVATMYLDSEEGGGTGEFVSEPWAANCAIAIVGIGPEPEPVPEEQLIDSIICPILAEVFPPEGDIPWVWDCPPYGSAPAGAEGGNGEAQAGRGSAPGQAKKKTLTPVHPVGTIEITQLPTGTLTFAYSGFSPGLTQWDCQEAGTSVTCTPPAPAAGFVNVCGVISVDVTNNGTGTASGTTACATSNAVVAVSLGPTAPDSDSATAETAFPWTCEGVSSPPVPAAWVVKCQVAAPPP